MMLPNNVYLHAKSNHPPSFIEQLPKIVNKSISELSFDESEFNNAKVIYKLALKHSGYKSEMKFDQKPSTRRNRNRKIICFNLPFRQSVKTDIGKLFFKKVQKKFSKNHRCREIINLNTLKLSYSSMANFQSLIKKTFLCLKVISQMHCIQSRSCYHWKMYAILWNIRWTVQNGMLT